MTPDGLVYEPELIDPRQERDLLERFEALEFQEIRMHGQVARRRAIHYGIDYDYDNPRRIVEAEPIPAWLEAARSKCAGLADVQQEELVEALVQRYPPGATIGWHRDAPQFGRVAGLSLGSACRLRLRRVIDHSQTAEVVLEPRSGYLFSGSVRWQWQHSIPPTKDLRYSITFRTLRRT
jgi:alkylated DNA repair protein (DNA oxidative demethylase)